MFNFLNSLVGIPNRELRILHVVSPGEIREWDDEVKANFNKPECPSRLILFGENNNGSAQYEGVNIAGYCNNLGELTKMVSQLKEPPTCITVSTHLYTHKHIVEALKESCGKKVGIAEHGPQPVVDNRYSNDRSGRE